MNASPFGPVGTPLNRNVTPASREERVVALIERAIVECEADQRDFAAYLLEVAKREVLNRAN